MAPGISGFGTRSGTIDSQAGVFSDHAALSDEGGQEQQQRRSEIERDQGGENRHQRGDRVRDRDDHPPRIDDIGDSARGKSEQEHRQRRRRVHQRHVQRIEVERRHQPARRRIIHRDADERARARRPDDRERRMGESAEPARRFCRGLSGECGSPSSNVPRGAWTERLVGNESAAFGSGAAGPASLRRTPTRADGCVRTRPPRSNRPQAPWRSRRDARPRLPSAATPDNSSRPRAGQASRRHPTIGVAPPRFRAR